MRFLHSIAAGRLWDELESGRRSSLLLDVTLPRLTSTFIAKGKIGGYGRGVARNGMVLLMSSYDLAAIECSRVRLRISIWHRAILPGDRPAPHGILLVADALKANRAQVTAQDSARQSLAGSLSGSRDTNAALSIEIGGGRFLNFV